MAYPALSDEWSEAIELTRTMEQTPQTFEDVEDVARKGKFKDDNVLLLDRTSSSTNNELLTNDQLQVSAC